MAQTIEERRAAQRERERNKRAFIKENDPNAYALYLEKCRARNKRLVAEGYHRERYAKAMQDPEQKKKIRERQRENARRKAALPEAVESRLKRKQERMTAIAAIKAARAEQDRIHRRVYAREYYHRLKTQDPERFAARVMMAKGVQKRPHNMARKCLSDSMGVSCRDIPDELVEVKVLHRQVERLVMESVRGKQ